MRKHFLLLFLMALLPLAGWAATLEDATIIVNDMVYGGAAPTVFKVQIGAVELNSSTDYTADYTRFYRDEACTDLVKDEDQNPVAAAALPAGSYYYVKVSGDGANYSGYKGGKFFVNKKSITLDVTLGTFVKYYDGITHTNEAVPTGTTFALHEGSALVTGESLTGANGVIKGTLVMSYAATVASKTPAGAAFATPVADAVVTYSGLSADNYKITISNGTLPIRQFSIVDNAGNLVSAMSITSTGNTVTYNKTVQAPTFAVTFNGTNVLDAFDVVLTSGANSNKNAGTATYKVAAKANSNFAGEYAGKEAAGDLNTYKMTIKKAAAFIKAKKISRVYNGETTLATANLYSTADDIVWTGIFDGDAITGNPTLNVNEDAKDAGDYTIRITAPGAGWTQTSGGDNVDNYAIGIDNSGVYEITKRVLTLTAKNKAVSFGDAVPTFTVADVTITNYLNADELDELKKGITAQFVSTFDYATAGAGEFPNVIEPVVDETKAAETFKNYKWSETLVKGKLTIGAAQILVQIKPLEKFYGETDDAEAIAASYTIAGATDGLLTNPVVQRAAGEHVGEYLMTIKTEATAKPGYEVLYTSTPVKFTIKKAQLTFTMPTKNIAKQSTVSALTKEGILVEGINNSDEGANLFDLSFGAGVTVDAGKATTDETKTYKATLKNTNFLKENNIWYKVTDLYEIITDATTNPVTTGTVIEGKLIVGNGTADAIQFRSSDATTSPAYDGDLARINAKAGETQNVKIYFGPRNGRILGKARNWKAGEWSTMVLPFDISVADLSKTLGYAIVNVINPEKTVISGTGSKFYGKLTMTGGNGNDTKLAANKPFLIKLAEDLKVSTDDPTPADYYYDFGPQTIVAPNDLSVNADDAGTVKFTGTYTTKTVTKADNAAIWFMTGNPVGDDSAWFYITSAATWDIVPFEAYIDMSQVPNEARNMTFYVEELDGSVTAINGVTKEVIGTNLNADGWYTLNGVKLNAAPTEKGIYINNGKKIVIK